jgi:hypothetical protein
MLAAFLAFLVLALVLALVSLAALTALRLHRLLVPMASSEDTLSFQALHEPSLGFALGSAAVGALGSS